jgi:hypothetical protein
MLEKATSQAQKAANAKGATLGFGSVGEAPGMSVLRGMMDPVHVPTAGGKTLSQLEDDLAGAVGKCTGMRMLSVAGPSCDIDKMRRLRKQVADLRARGTFLNRHVNRMYLFPTTSRPGAMFDQFEPRFGVFCPVI